MKKLAVLILVSLVMINISACIPNFDFLYPENDKNNSVNADEILAEKEKQRLEEEERRKISQINTTDEIIAEKVYMDFTIPYATFSIINDGYATLYKHNPYYGVNFDEVKLASVSIAKRYTVAVNAGHGTKGGSVIKTFSHPDFSPKVTGGTNQEGSILSSAISDGTVLKDGTKEADANLKVAIRLKEKLLAAGYDVLMIRENDDTRLDNIARTILANKYSNAHIAIHFDSTDYDKGIFYVVPYKNDIYLNMEPLKSNVDRIMTLGKSVIAAFHELDERVWHDSGTLQGDLTQLSFSTNGSIDVELGDRATIVTDEKVEVFAEGIKRGLDKYFISDVFLNSLQ